MKVKLIRKMMVTVAMMIGLTSLTYANTTISVTTQPSSPQSVSIGNSIQLSYTVQNNLSTPLLLSGFSFTSSSLFSSPPSVNSSACPSSLNPIGTAGDNCIVTVTVTGGAEGTASNQYLTIAYGGGATINSSAIDINVTSATSSAALWQMSASIPVPTSLVLGEANHDTTQVIYTVENLEQPGGAALNITGKTPGVVGTGLTIPTIDAGSSTCSQYEGSTTGLPAGDTCTYVLNATANAVSSEGAYITLDVIANGGNYNNTGDNSSGAFYTAVPIIVNSSLATWSMPTGVAKATALTVGSSTQVTYTVTNTTSAGGAALQFSSATPTVTGTGLSSPTIDQSSSCLQYQAPSAGLSAGDSCTYIVGVDASEVGSGSVALTVDTQNGSYNGEGASTSGSVGSDSITVSPASSSDDFSITAQPLVNSSLTVNEPLVIAYQVKNTSQNEVTIVSATASSSDSNVLTKIDMNWGSCVAGKQLQPNNFCTYRVAVVGKEASADAVTTSLTVNTAVDGSTETASAQSTPFQVLSPTTTNWAITVSYNGDTAGGENILNVGESAKLTYVVQNRTQQSAQVTSASGLPLIGSTPVASKKALGLSPLQLSSGPSTCSQGVVDAQQSCVYTSNVSGLQAAAGVDIALPVTVSLNGTKSYQAAILSLQVIPPVWNMTVAKQTPSNLFSGTSTASFSVLLSNNGSSDISDLAYTLSLNGATSSQYTLTSNKNGECQPQGTLAKNSSCLVTVELQTAGWTASSPQTPTLEVSSAGATPGALKVVLNPITVVASDSVLPLTLNCASLPSGSSSSMYINSQMSFSCQVGNPNKFAVGLAQLNITESSSTDAFTTPLVSSNCISTEGQSQLLNHVPAGNGTVSGSCLLFVTLGATPTGVSKPVTVTLSLANDFSESSPTSSWLPSYQFALSVVKPTVTTQISYQNNCQQPISVALLSSPVSETAICSTNSNCPNGSSCVTGSSGKSLCYWNMPLSENEKTVQGKQVLDYQIPQAGGSLVLTVPYSSSLPSSVAWSGVSVGRLGCDPSDPTKACALNSCAFPPGIHFLAAKGMEGQVIPATCQPLTSFNGGLTEAKITLGSVTATARSTDQYAVSFVDGFNVPVSIGPALLPSGSYSSDAPYTCGVAGSGTDQGTLGACQWNYNELGGMTPSWPQTWSNISGSETGSYMTRVIMTSNQPQTCTSNSQCTGLGPNAACGLTDAEIKGPTGAGHSPQLQCGTFAGYWSLGAVCQLNGNLGSPFNCDLPASPGLTLGNWYQCHASSATSPANQSCYSGLNSSQNCCGCQNWSGSPTNLTTVPSSVQSCNGGNSFWRANGLSMYYAFKAACPSAETYRFDTASSQFNCNVNGSGQPGQPLKYVVTFCPATGSN